MIVRDPEKRATLDEVMSDVWYRKSEGEDDDDYDDDITTDLVKLISKDDHESILHQMIDGNIAEQEAISKALNEDQYNHITATYYLLAEKLLYDNQKRTMKQKRRVLQPASDPFTEQIGVFVFSSSK
jgi:SNF-related kinase